ncbi:miniconductance mechanosensitive channel MscM [Photobacterium sanguinicancri]|uniref:miniconductance mechanosensitive channel MscM n=1 Tax=Photobacterium sanguinicancri TaxID=875932 RepID=UPI0026E1ACD5|nr:miniconductance mechanosensitive channel MscM [Photobacterium sanguinicancri]MDO6498432.1 miniconductance mechanosensitive channel MscM [Photobacterium sanguinicancri]
MAIFKHLLISTMLFYFSVLSCHADELTNTQEILTQKIEQLEQEPKTPDTLKILDTFQKAQRQLEQIKDFNRQTKDYQQLMADYPRLSDELKEQISIFSVTEFPDFTDWNADQLTLEMATQDQKLQQLEQTRKTQKNIFSDIEQGIDLFSIQTEQLRTKIKATENKIRVETNTSNNADKLLVLDIANQYYISQVYMLEAEQLSAGNRRQLAKLSIQRINLDIEASQAYRNNLQNMLNRVERASVDEAAEQSDELQSELMNQPTEIRRLVLTNKQISNALTAMTTQTEQVQQLQQQTTAHLAQVSRATEELERVSEWLRLSPAFSETLRTRIKELPANPPIEVLDQQIAQHQIKKYEYQQQLDRLIAQAKLPASKNLTPDQQSTEKELIAANIDLLKQVINSSDKIIYQEATLKVAYDKLNNALIELASESQKELFWAPDTNSLSWNLIIDTVEKTRWFFSPFQWVNIVKLPTALTLPSFIFTATFIGLLLIVSRWSRKRWKVRLERIEKQIGKVTLDKFRFSYINVLIAFVLAWPIPLCVILLGNLLSEAWQYPFFHHLGQALTLPLSLVVYCFIRELVRDNGLFISHFGWNKKVVKDAFGHYRTFMWVYFPMMVIQEFTLLYSDVDVRATIGRLAFIISNVAVSYFLYKLWRDKMPMTYGDVPDGKAHFRHHLIFGVFIAIPQGLNYTALLGYLSSAQSVMVKLEVSAFVGVVTLLIYFLTKRLMLIQKRRLAFERAKTKRQEILAQRLAEMNEEREEFHTSSEMQIEIEEPEIDLDKISAQSLRLLRSLLFLIFLSILAVLWADLYQATTLLEDVTLWDVTNTINGIDELSAITVKSAFLALLAFGLTAVFARDLPAAMELLILQHVELSPGTGYALTSLTRYITIFVGIIVGSGLIGFDWSKMQWLVAALGVGLGFGLQEIFANFISGIIILFERPIRIGDTVTIRDLTGVIAKIQTRATTIVDWDRKEVIVPNKAFVTEQFVNWSLSDAITRVTLTINVKYMADSELVTQLLFDAAHECELVIDNPAPEVFFLGLSADCQNFEVRAYAAETGHRLSLTHDLHCRIKQKFIQHNIDIAHPQLEVAIKNQKSHPFARRRFAKA